MASLMQIWIPLILLSVLVAGCVAVACISHRRYRPVPTGIPLSFIVPCYNDGETVAETIEAIFEAAGSHDIEVWVANDGSTDDSAARLAELALKHPIHIVHNPHNMGKALTLNRLAAMARHAFLIFVDADTLIHERALKDMLARLTSTPAVGAVSCPYRPRNRGWLPSLQAIDYSMIALVQAGYNALSGLALWGGCIAVRRVAFEQANGFSMRAITEDVDLAHRLNRLGWRVQQSLVPVRSWVPDTLRGWMRQKMRWTAGGFQCLYLHLGVWTKNPLHVLLLSLYSFLSVHCLITTAKNTMMLKALCDLLEVLYRALPVHVFFDLLPDLFWFIFMQNILVTLGFGLLTAVYVVPLISRWRDIPKFLLVVPFMVAYFPLYVVVSILGLLYFMRHAKRLALAEERAW